MSLEIALFDLINKTLTHPWLTEFFVFFTNVHKTLFFKIGFSILLVFWIYKCKWNVGKVLLSIALVVGSADAFSYRVLKEFIERPRPHHIESIQSEMRLEYGPKSASFPSNHATNTTALAMTVAFFYPFLMWPAVITTVLIAYSRVYVGVHFVSDVLAGILIGSLLGFLWIKFVFNRFEFFKKARLSSKTTEPK